ncbi:hypothetical protein ACA910_012601 [Epithemia clementina (nom. ined.)]
MTIISHQLIPCLLWFGWRTLLVVEKGPFALAASSSSTVPSSSSSNLILDKYGDAVQIRHARNAAQQQGSFVMILDRGCYSSHDDKSADATIASDDDVQRKRRRRRRRKHGDIWVISTAEKDDAGAGAGVDSSSHLRSRHLTTRTRTSNNYDQQSTKNSDDPTKNSLVGLGEIYQGASYFMHPLLSSFSHSFHSDQGERSTEVAVVSVGVQADAKWLLGILQEYAARVWERTDTHIGVPAVLAAVSTILCRSATKYPRVPNSYGPSLEALLTKKDNESLLQLETSSWSRPLGLCVVVLALSSSSAGRSLDETPRMHRIDPSGMVEPIVAKFVCLGKYSAEMETWWQNHVDKNDANKKHDKNFMSDLELCQYLRRGISHIWGHDRLPEYLRIEIWCDSDNDHDHDLSKIQRRIVSLKDP